MNFASFNFKQGFKDNVRPNDILRCSHQRFVVVTCLTFRLFLHWNRTEVTQSSVSTNQLHLYNYFDPYWRIHFVNV